METVSGSPRLPGAQLRAAREKAGLSEAEIATRLHLSVSYVKALEADNYSKLPEATFVRGYIKNYAREVGLPADDLANLYRELNPVVQEDVSKPLDVLPAQPQRKKLWLGLVAVLLLLVVLGILFGGSADQDESVDVAPPSGQSLNLAPVEDAQPEHSSELVAAEAVEPPLEIVELPAEPLAAVDRLVIRFEQTCWIRIRDADGTEVYAGQRPANSVFQQEGQGPFRVTFGDASAVASVHVNDVAVAVPAAQPGKVLTIRTP